MEMKLCYIHYTLHIHTAQHVNEIFISISHLHSQLGYSSCSMYEKRFMMHGSLVDMHVPPKLYQGNRVVKALDLRSNVRMHTSFKPTPGKLGKSLGTRL